MPVTDSAAEKRLEPLVLVDTAGLTEEEWLSYRRRGIGGSDVAALLGISPWRTARDLYYDKLNVAAVEDEEGNWVALEMGHLLEPLVAKIFERKTGYKIYQIKLMHNSAKYKYLCHNTSFPRLWRYYLYIKSASRNPAIKGRGNTTDTCIQT